MLPSLALTHWNLEDMGKMVSSEVTSLQEEEGAMDCLTGDVLSIVLGEREGERGRGEGRERKHDIDVYTIQFYVHVHLCL